MRSRSVLSVVLIGAATVVAVDLLLQNTLVGELVARVESPADGARLRPPVTVRWSGPRKMRAILSGPGGALDLGWRGSPFEIGADQVARSGDYTLELRPWLFGRWFAHQARFSVTREGRRRRAANGRREEDAQAPLRAQLEVLRNERDAANAVNADLYEENGQLRRENAELTQANARLQEEQADAVQRAQAFAALQGQLEERLGALEDENRVLRSRLASIPPCLAWGYLTYPRPQLLPRTRRVVVVSNTRGEVFRDERECEAFRRQDQTAASRCDCVAGP